MTFIYPRLRRDAAEEQLEALNEEFLESGNIAYAADFRHPKAFYPNLNAPLVPSWRLKELHDQLAEQLPSTGRPGSEEKRQFDIRAGKLLVKALEEDGQLQAADPDMWAFLSLVAFPDIALARFRPESRSRLTPERFMAGRRNVFYVPYLRAWILGDLVDDPDAILLEDELVGLVDRQISTDHRLARSLVRAIAGHKGTDNRREIVRECFKAIRFKQRVTDFSAFSDEELDSIVRGVMNESGRP